MRVHLLAMTWLAALLAVAEPDHTGPMREGSRKNGALMHLSSKHVVSILKGTAAQRPFTSHASLDGDSEEDDEDGDGDDTEAKDRNGHRKKRGWVYLIRHGEKFKNSDKTGLSEKGIQRAKCLIDVFGGHGAGSHHIDYILAQDFKPSGQRRRPYETVKPLSKQHDIPLDHSCDRDDTDCVAKKIKKRAGRGEDLLVVWEHARLSRIARALGVKGLVYPSSRYDVIFKVKGRKVHAIYSEECDGLDNEWFHWKGKRLGKHGKSPHGGRLIDDESWADDGKEE